ncbi:MAG: MFS transporter [Candidatus Heimdallarchaeota archaeon]
MADSNPEKFDNGLELNGANQAEIAQEEKKRFRDFIFFFSGQQISILGSSVVSFVLIWWMSETTQSELMLGLAALASLGPFLLVAPFSGVIADRAKRKPLLFTVDTIQALFTVMLTIIFMLFYVPNPADPTQISNKTLLIVSVFITLGLRGAMQAFHSPVVSALIPTMVPQKHLGRMNGASYLVSGVIQVIGPALGALLLNIFDVSLTMWIDVITFAIAVIPLLLIKIPSPVQQEKSDRPKFSTQFKEGFSVIKDIKGLLAIMIGATLINFFFSPISTLLPLFVSKVHGGTEASYALVIGFMQVGVILGGLFMTFFKGFKNKIRAVLVCVLILFAAEIALVFVPTTLPIRFWIIGLILFIGMIPNPMANVSFSTSLQLVVPKEKMGRVSSTTMFMSMAIAPIGMFLSGLIGEYVPIGILFAVSGALGAVIFISIYFFTPAKHLDESINMKIAELAKDKEESSQALDGYDDIFDDASESEKSSEPFALDRNITVGDPSLE